MTESYVTMASYGTTFVGPDATRLYAAASLRTALRLAAKGLRVSYRVTPTMLLAQAGRLTGKTYKRGQYLRAADDVEAWIGAMQAAMPVEVER